MRTSHQPAKVDISVIVPFYNEEENIEAVYRSVVAVLAPLGKTYEIIFVDDGSSDTTVKRARALAQTDGKLKVVELLRNYGQTAAMMAGIDFASGTVVVAMDGDGQNDPADIPRLLDELGKGFDVVSGWRKDRQDHASRTFPSRVANWLISKISGVSLHDYGCSLKAYRCDVIKDIRLYGEMHRFIPIYMKWLGGKISEIPVNHHPRTHGTSKYGFNRIFKVLLDLTLVVFLERFTTKPIYVFGGFGLLSLAGGLLCFLWMLGLKLFTGLSFILTPLPVLTAILCATGVMSILMGLQAELTVRTYYEAQDKRIYSVRSLTNIEE
ncbi:MAG TPA: glycosyltransferase family 2 protein [Patescibacteria group bacterium]|nr:glycosyltransferase family 2 protein [Patescibacteria group bacterium]